MKHKVQYNAKKSYYLECLVCGRAFSGTVPYEYQPVLFRFDSAAGVWELAGSSGRNWAAAGSFQKRKMSKSEAYGNECPGKELWRYSGDAMCPSQKHRRHRSVLLTLAMAPGRLFRTIK